MYFAIGVQSVSHFMGQNTRTEMILKKIHHNMQLKLGKLIAYKKSENILYPHSS